MNWLRSLVVVAALALGATSASGATYCVGVAGCVGEQRVDLSTALMDAAAAGGSNTIHLGPGAYTVTAAAAAQDYTLIGIAGAGRDATTITVAQGSVWVVEQAGVSAVTVRGNTPSLSGFFQVIGGALSSARVVSDTPAGVDAAAVVVDNTDLNDVDVQSADHGVIDILSGAAAVHDRIENVTVSARYGIVVVDEQDGTATGSTITIARARLSCSRVCVDAFTVGSGDRGGSAAKTLTIQDSTLRAHSSSGATAVSLSTTTTAGRTLPHRMTTNIVRSTIHHSLSAATALHVELDRSDLAAAAPGQDLHVVGTSITGFTRSASIDRRNACAVASSPCTFTGTAENVNADFSVAGVASSTAPADSFTLTGTNTVVDPLFSSSRDLQIRWDSPLRNRYACGPTDDATGVGVRTDGWCDVGAYEYVAIAPTISRMTVPQRSTPGTSVSAFAIATDPNVGESMDLTYTWVVDRVGTFAGRSVTFSIPAGVAGTIPVTLHVTDPTGLVTTRTILMTVSSSTTVIQRPPTPRVTFTRPDGTTFTCLPGDYDPPRLTAGGAVPTVAQIRARRAVRVTVTPSETGSMRVRMVASYAARTSTGRAVTRRVRFNAITRPGTAGRPTVVSFPMSAAQRTTLLSKQRVGPIIWVASGVVRDQRGNARGFTKRLAGPLRLSPIPPRLNCGRSLPDVSAPGVVIPIGQMVRRVAPRSLKVTVNEAARVSVRVVARVNLPVAGKRRTITYLLATGTGSSTGAGTVTVPLTFNAKAWRTMSAAAARPGARRLTNRAYVVGVDLVGNTRKVNATVGVR